MFKQAFNYASVLFAIILLSACGSSGSGGGGGAPSGTTYTAHGTYVYNSNTNVLKTILIDSTFPSCNGPQVGTTLLTVTALNATNLTWINSNNETTTWTRTSGTIGITGTWTLSDNSTGNSFTLTINSDGTMSVVGNIVKIANCSSSFTLTVKVSGTGSGSITSAPAGIDCGKTCNASFTNGTTVTLTATPVPGSTFAGWAVVGGGCPGTGTCMVTLTANTTVTAQFNSGGGGGGGPVSLTVNGNGSGSGTVTTQTGLNCTITNGVSVSGCQISVSSNTPVTLTENPATGSTFGGWGVVGGACSGTGSCTFTPTADTVVTAQFNSGGGGGGGGGSNVTLTITGGGSGSGTVTSDTQPALNCNIANGIAGSGCTISVSSGTVATLTFTSSPRSVLGSWQVIQGSACNPIPSTNSCSVTLSTDTTLQFIFNSSGGGGGGGSGGVGYTISGTVSYGGSQTGRIYISANNGCTNCATYGKSIKGSAFTIRGVAPGTYTLNAYMDTLGWGATNASNPTGSVSSITVSNSNVTAGQITLNDPSSPVTPTTPTGLYAFPGDHSALVTWNRITSNGMEMVESYNIYCDSAPCIQSPANGENGGHAFYATTSMGQHTFQISSVAGGHESALSSPFGVNIGPLSGGSTVSGTVNLPGSAGVNSNLYVLLCSFCGGNPGSSYLTAIRNPSTIAPGYSITGVANGTYMVIVFMDNDNNGYGSAGDWSNDTQIHPQMVAVNGNITVDVTLSTAASSHAVTTENFYGGSFQNYNLRVEVVSQSKLPVNVAVTSGANLSLPIDLANRPGSSSRFDPSVSMGPTAPSGSYGLTIEYSDGSIDTPSSPPVTVLTSFARPTAPISNGCCGLQPTFSWTAPASPPLLPYTYRLWVGLANGGFVWGYPNNGAGMPASQLLVPYNKDGTASASSLTTGSTYDWNISVIDADNNIATYSTTYTP